MVEIHCLTIVEARSSKSRCQWSHAAFELDRNDPFHHHLLWLVALNIPWIAYVSLYTYIFPAFSLVSPHCLPFHVSVSVSKSPTFNKDVSHIGFGPP